MIAGIDNQDIAFLDGGPAGDHLGRVQAIVGYQVGDIDHNAGST